MVYIFGWVCMFLSVLFLNKRGGFFIVYLVMLYCVFIAFFRGDVGTDTANYISMFTAEKNGYDIPIGEVGFKYLISFLNYIFDTPDVAVKSVSIIFFALLALYFYKANKNESFLLLAYFFPVFSYAYSMNGLRVGLAVCFFLLGMQSYSNKGFVFSTIKYILLSIMFHMSALLLPVFYFLFKVKWSRLRYLFRFLFFAFFILLFLIINSDYFILKIDSYSSGESISPSIFSGLSIVVSLLVVLVSVLFGKLPKADRLRIFLVSFFAIFLSFILAKFSYAGLRVLDLLAVLVPVIILMSYNERKIIFDKYIKVGLILGALLSIISTYLGYLSYYGAGRTPFLPYFFGFS